MTDLIYLKVSGQQQGMLSAGCGTYASVGNRWQVEHEDEIFTFGLTNSVTNTGYGSNLHGLKFSKLIDKSTPLFCNSINDNEQLFMEFEFYRINRYGRWEKYYYIQLRGASVSDIYYQFAIDKLDTECITIIYEYILCKHLIANTEFSHLMFPENYSDLFIPEQFHAAKPLKTLNSKAVGRLLAAGGVYNGNIDGFRETAEKLGSDTVTGYEQVLNDQTKGAIIAAASLLLVKKTSHINDLDPMRGYLGKLRGESTLLKDMEIKQIDYIKRSSQDLVMLRKEFNNVSRKKFLNHASNSPEIAKRFNLNELAEMRKGIAPEGWHVHHKLPLDDSGTNDVSNLVLIQNEPFHKVLTNFQNTTTRGMIAGQSKTIAWVIPKGVIYP